MSSSKNIVLEAKNISKYFGTITALENVNLTVRQGECLGVVGDNGAGKSTFMKVLSGLYITPFKIKGSESIVLVNRGWHPNLKNREMLPVINEIEGKRLLLGYVADFPVSGIKLGKNNIETLNSQIFRFQRLCS